jgi:hypothetical protein
MIYPNLKTKLTGQLEPGELFRILVGDDPMLGIAVGNPTPIENSLLGLVYLEHNDPYFHTPLYMSLADHQEICLSYGRQFEILLSNDPEKIDIGGHRHRRGPGAIVVGGDSIVIAAHSPNPANPLSLKYVDAMKWELVEGPQSPNLVTIYASKLRLRGFPEDHGEPYSSSQPRRSSAACGGPSAIWRRAG